MPRESRQNAANYLLISGCFYTIFRSFDFFRAFGYNGWIVARNPCGVFFASSHPFTPRPNTDSTAEHFLYFCNSMLGALLQKRKPDTRKSPVGGKSPEV